MAYNKGTLTYDRTAAAIKAEEHVESSSEWPASGNSLDPSERAVVEDDLVSKVRRFNTMPKSFFNRS